MVVVTDQEKRFGYSLNLKLSTDKPFFGPGVIELLDRICETKSINSAAKGMGMSYNKAWRILKRAEQEIGYPLIITNIGGANGGGSIVTEEGKCLMKKYQLFQQKTYEVVDEYFNDIFAKELEG